MHRSLRTLLSLVAGAIGPEQVRAYLLHLVQERGVSFGYYKQTRSALRFLYRVTLGRDDVLDAIPPVKQPRTLPVVLSPDEVARFFAAISNVKHRAILMTAYAGGLRLSEVTQLQVTDIDSQRMVIHVRNGKGRKDRYVMLSPRLLEILRAYWKAARPPDNLFPGAIPGRPITTASVQKVCQRARRRAGLGKNIILEKYDAKLTCEQRRALKDLTACRTAALGGHVLECLECGH